MLNKPTAVAEAVCSFRITEATWHRRRNAQLGIKAAVATRLEELRAEKVGP